MIFMDYSKFSSKAGKRGYIELLWSFYGISAVLREKILSLGDTDNMVLFGFSFGSRLAIDAGIDVAEKGFEIDKIYACDPAGPGFYYYARDPQKAAKFVQCINTSADKGTNVYNCHQNWRFAIKLILNAICNA